MKRKTKEQREMAVLVAKDTIKLLNPKNKRHFRPEHNTYCSISQKAVAKYSKEYPIAQNALKAGMVKDCEVCAIGGLFIAHVMRHDGLPTSSLRYQCSIEMRKRLQACFTHDELWSIEDAYEGYLRYLPPTVALKVICERIIEKNGCFVCLSHKHLNELCDKYSDIVGFVSDTANATVFSLEST